MTDSFFVAELIVLMIAAIACSVAASIATDNWLSLHHEKREEELDD